MKVTFIALLLGLASTNVVAHSHSPSEFGGPENPLQSITMTPVVIVPVVVGNLNSFPQSYDIYDGDEKLNTITVAPGVFRNLQVPVKLLTPNTPELHEVCSISVPREGEMFRTRICTDAKVYWLKK